MSTAMLIFAGALILALGGTPLARRLAPRLGMIDQPDARKVHQRPMPRMGGAAIVLACLAAVLLFRERIEFQQLVGIVLGGAFVSLIGALDDRWGMAPLVKLIGQFFAAGILIATGLTIQLLPVAWLNYGLTALWIVGITNAFNLLDNMDGLSSGVAAIAAAFFTLLAALSKQSYVSALSAAVLGATLGFLIYNFNPASIFMGDSGSLFIGFVLAAIGVKLRFPDNVNFVTWMAPVLVLSVPLFDTALVSISRLRRGLNPLTTPGKDHTSHRLVAAGFSTREAVMLHYLAGGAYGLLAIFVTQATVFEGYVAGGAAALLGLYTLIRLEHQFRRHLISPSAQPSPSKGEGAGSLSPPGSR
ncbi:MAG TPA: MraY family glycosyltransferase [Anaerolineae bacterium]|nr:MraY family glycosyltransferase [Anaerolineae bacterium]